MDFPVCPACGQSVIDDDVEDCPFCGASMKARPGAKPAAKSAAAGKAPAPAGKSPAAGKSTVAAKPAAGKPSAGKPGPADDFPFETEVPGAKTAIQAMPNPSKGRTLEVVCPMCETKGFLPPSAAGKDVKCANPKCLVPVFKAAAAPVEAPPPPPPPKKSNLALIGGLTVAIMAAAGGAIVFMSGQPGNSPVKKELSEEDKAALAEMAKDSPAAAPAKPDDLPRPTELTGGKTARRDGVPATPDEFIAAALKELNDACLKRDNRQRSKPYCRKLAAGASIRAGDQKGANEHLAQLMVVGSGVPYYRVEPNLELFWKAWAANDKATASRLLETSLEDVRNLPKVGRSQLEVASRLAAALVVAGRVKEAQTLIDDHQSAELEGQLSARVQMASDGRISRVTNSGAVLPWLQPQAVATTASLTARGQLDAARTWAASQSTPEKQVECLAVWAEGVAVRQAKPGSAESNPEIAEAVKGLAPALAARVWARAACGRIAADDRPGALATLKVAEDLLASIAPPPEPAMPDLKATINYKVAESAPLVHGATAAAEVAFVHTMIPDHSSQAEQSLEQSLNFARALAPAWSAVGSRVTQAEQAGQAGMRDIIKKELALKSDDVASQNAIRYRNVLSDLGDASQHRFDLQVRILTRLAEAGLKDKAWSVVSNRSAESNPSRRDDFLGTPLVGELLEAFRGTETEKVIQGAVGSSPPAPPDAAVAKQVLLAQGPAQAAQFVSHLDANSGHRDDVALMLATQLAAAGEHENALTFISRLDDIVLREEAYSLVSAQMTQRGHAAAVWKQIAAVQQATEKAALCHGLIVGLKAGPPQKELP